MAGVATYTKSGTKAAKTTTLDKKVFAENTDNHELLKLAYNRHLAGSRINLAKTKRRGEVRGSTAKPWQQKGTGRARFGSKYNPLWRGGGVVFGPLGEENYKKSMSKQSKRKALRQALSLVHADNKIKVVETFVYMDKKTKDMASFLDKIDAKGNILCVVSKLDPKKELATRNIANLRLKQADFLTVYDVLNADTIVISSKSLDVITNWLSDSSKTTQNSGGSK